MSVGHLVSQMAILVQSAVVLQSQSPARTETHTGHMCSLPMVQTLQPVICMDKSYQKNQT